jgi:hypothetical protein
MDRKYEEAYAKNGGGLWGTLSGAAAWIGAGLDVSTWGKGVNDEEVAVDYLRSIGALGENEDWSDAKKKLGAKNVEDGVTVKIDGVEQTLSTSDMMQSIASKESEKAAAVEIDELTDRFEDMEKVLADNGLSSMADSVATLLLGTEGADLTNLTGSEIGSLTSNIRKELAAALMVSIDDINAIIASEQERRAKLVTEYTKDIETGATQEKS